MPGKNAKIEYSFLYIICVFVLCNWPAQLLGTLMALGLVMERIQPLDIIFQQLVYFVHKTLLCFA